MSRRGPGSAAGLIVCATGAILVSLLATVAVGAAPGDPARVAAVFPPWWTPVQTMSAAASAGQIAGAGGLPFILILRGDPIDLAQRTRAAGALLVLDPSMAGVCAPKDPNP